MSEKTTLHDCKGHTGPARLTAGTAHLVVFSILISGCTELPDASLSGRPELRESDLYVVVADQTVTVNARDATIGELIDEIARQSGLLVVSGDSLDARITMEFERVPVPDAIRRVLGERNFTLNYAANAQDNRLWIFSESGNPADEHQIEENRKVSVSEASLHDALVDPDADVRMDAIAALPMFGSQQTITVLTGAALNDVDPSVRAEAVLALGEIGKAGSAPVLAQALIDADRDVREAAVEAFVGIGGDESARALGFALFDSDASMRADVVDALGEIGGETAVQLLERALADEDSRVRQAAEEYLAEMSDEER